ncbi:hypothetical protein [Cetobacterium sp.]|uniref:hypothetical protein n=1 Tax=Cetobacterium sp. TaxID=2071632 RepID=UPI003F2CCCC3
MNIELSLIKDINIDKVMFDGSAYIIEEESDEIGINSFSKHSFDSVINGIVNQYDKEETYNSINNIHENITEYLETTGNIKKRIILLPDTGIRGIDKVNYNLNSIMYFKVSDDFGIGFFVNKTLATFLTQNLTYVNKN